MIKAPTTTIEISTNNLKLLSDLIDFLNDYPAPESDEQYENENTIIKVK